MNDDVRFEPGYRQDETGALVLDARVIPTPRTISVAAQRALEAAAGQPWPIAPQEENAWNKYLTFCRAVTDKGVDAAAIATALSTVHTETVGEVSVYRAMSLRDPAASSRILLDIHGGAHMFSGGPGVALRARRLADRFGCLVYSVDYRLAPEHPYPAALNDCLETYRWLLEKHPASQIIVGGASAGGNLTAALALKARDEGLPLPAALVLLTPAVDLTGAGDTHVTNRYVDVSLRTPIDELHRRYAPGQDLAHPYISPLFGDFSRGYPPVFLQSGTRDLFLSGIVRMHRKLLANRIPAQLHVWEAMSHGGFGGATPEDQEVEAAVLEFMDHYWRGR